MIKKAVTKEGEEIFLNRPTSVVGFIFIYLRDTDKVYILANQRGKGTPNCQGLWNCPCGYLEFNETTEEACMREVLEETGLHLEPMDLTFFEYNDDPKDSEDQSIVFKFYARINSTSSSILPELNSLFSEKDEVESIKLIPLDKIDSYEWAFNHENNIKRIIKYLEYE